MPPCIPGGFQGITKKVFRHEITTPERTSLLFPNGYTHCGTVSTQQTPCLLPAPTQPYRIFRHKDNALFHNKQFFCLFLIFSLSVPGKMLIFAGETDHGALAHLARAFDWQSKGGRFESCMLHVIPQDIKTGRAKTGTPL